MHQGQPIPSLVLWWDWWCERDRSALAEVLRACLMIAARRKKKLADLHLNSLLIVLRCIRASVHFEARSTNWDCRTFCNEPRWTSTEHLLHTLCTAVIYWDWWNYSTESTLNFKCLSLYYNNLKPKSLLEDLVWNLYLLVSEIDK